MNFLSRFAVSTLVLCGLASSAFAGTNAFAVYSPPVKIIQGPLPFTPPATPDPNFPVNPYTLTITAPAGITYPQTVKVGFNIATVGNVLGGVKVLPAGVSDVTALSYVSANPATLTFTAPGQTQSTIISVKIDATQSQSASIGDYGYVINTSNAVGSTGWPADAGLTVLDVSTGKLVNVGATINLTVQPAPVAPVPPTIKNLVPTNGTNFTYDPATGPIVFPISFDATVVGGAPTDKITSLSATIDGDAFNGVNTYSRSADNPPEVLALLAITGAQTLNAHGSVTSPRITDGGPHTITVTAFSATTPSVSASTTINVHTPPKFTSANNATFTLGLPGSFNVTADGFSAPTLSLVSGSLPAGITFNSTTGVLSGTPTVMPAGPVTLTFQATNEVKSVTQIFTLTIGKATLTVTADNASRPFGAANPTFTASYSGFVGGDTIAVLSGAPTLTTTATTTSTAGTYPIKAALGTLASANYNFAFVDGTLTVTNTTTNVAINGFVFLDVVNLGARDAGEFGLGCIPVRLYKAGVVYRSTTTNPDGTYSFTNVPQDTYEVDVVEPNGLRPTDSVTRLVSPTLGWSVRDFGLALNFDALPCLSAGGFTIGYWKNNIDKALAGKTSGIQVSATTLQNYTTAITTFASPVYSTLTMSQASSIMGSTSSTPANLLSKQLVASEYNYQNRAYLGGNQALTAAFVTWGEYVLQNAASLSSVYVLWTKDWFDAYNNTHGGCINGPAPLGSTSISANFNGTAIAAYNKVWFNAVVSITGRNTSVLTTVQFNRSAVTLPGSGCEDVTVDVPDNVITFDPAATMAVTFYDDSTDTWRTTVPASYTGNVFLGGCTYQTPVKISGGLSGVQWSGRFVSSTPNLTAQWKWAAAVYTQLDSDEGDVGAKPIDGNTANPYLNSDHAGVPELYKPYVIGGAMGGGGSNWTGSYSSTASVSVGQP